MNAFYPEVCHYRTVLLAALLLAVVRLTVRQAVHRIDVYKRQVTSLGGVEVPVDKLGLDFVYSGTQKCLSCPPGLAPITVGERGLEFIRNRKTKCQSWYLDLSMISRYWGGERFYHHTAPVNMIYAFNEALRIIKEEGLEARWARHRLNQKALIAGLEAMGMNLVVKPEYRLPSLTTVSYTHLDVYKRQVLYA